MVVWNEGVRIGSIELPMGWLGGADLMLQLPDWLSLLATLIWLVGITNAINWLDGLDGLAAGVSGIAAVGLLSVSFSLHQPAAGLLASALAGSCLGFLRHNFNPARIFMGDGGSYFLGFALAAISIVGPAKGLTSVSLLLPLLILSLPLADMSAVIMGRLSEGHSPFYPDRRHLHHRLLRAGFSHRRTVVLIYAFTQWLAALALVLANAELRFLWLALATAAAVIASQAVISGAFSMMQQAVQMGLLPRLEIRHTSETQHGQIYMPRVNMILMLSVICLVIAFGSSSRLASAYGIAVSGDMVITTILAFVLFLKAWKWPLMAVIAVIAPILIVELLFLGANMMKLHDGGYVPVAIAATMCVMIWSWVCGTNHVKQKAADSAISLVKLIAMLDKSQPMSVPGTAVFLTQDPNTAPSALLHNLKHNQILHERVVLMTIKTADKPFVKVSKQVETQDLGKNSCGRPGSKYGACRQFVSIVV